MDDFDLFFSPGAEPEKPKGKPSRPMRVEGSVGVAPTEQSALDIAREAIAHNETGHIALRGGDPYAAVGPAVKRKSGFVDNALGRYQIMRSNLRQWTEEALGQPLSEKEFLASPEAQDLVFNHRFGQYLMKYSPEDAASVWFSGRPLDKARGASDGHWTTEQYVKNFGKNAAPSVQGAVSAAPDDMDVFGPGSHVPPEMLEPQVPAPAPAAPRRLPPITIERPAQWGFPQAMLYGATLGQSPALAGLAGADPDAVHKARMLYMAENPLGEMAGELVGSLPPTAVATGLGMGGIAAAGRAIPALRGVASFLGGTAGNSMEGLGGMALRRASDLGYGATQGAIQGTVMSPLGQGSTGEQAGWGAAIGAPLGGTLNALIGRPVSQALHAGVTPEKRALFDAAKARGVPMYAAQLSDEPFMKGIPVAEELQHNQVGAFNKALAQSAGSADDHLTEAALAQHKTALGNEIGAITSRHDIVPTPELINDLKTILNNAHSNIIDTADQNKLKNLFRKLADELAQPGGLTGQKFQNFLKTGGMLSNAAKDPILAPYASELRGALNRAFEKVIPTGHPDEGALRLAKQRYATVRQIEKAISKASPEMVSPRAIHGATRGPAKPGKPIPQELKTLGDIGKYLPDVSAMGQLKHGSPGHWRMLQTMGPAGLLAGGATAGALGHDYIENAWKVMPPEWKNRVGAGGALIAMLLGGKALGRYALQTPRMNEAIIRGTVPSLPFSYNPFIAAGNQVGTRRD